MTTRRALLAGLLVAVGLAAGPVRPVGLDVAVTALPARLSDQQFWRLISQFSEQGGTFHSENFVSNEGRGTCGGCCDGCCAEIAIDVAMVTAVAMSR